MEVIVTGLAALLGAVVGAAISARASRQAARQSITVETLDSLAELTDVMWAEVPTGEVLKLQERVRSRLRYLGVPDAVTRELGAAATACFSEVKRNSERTGPGGVAPTPRLSMESVARFDAARDAVMDHLSK